MSLVTILIAIVNNILGAFSSLGWKKSITLANNAHNNSITLHGACTSIIMTLILIILGYTHTVSMGFIAIIFALQVGFAIIQPLSRRIWREEKVAFILPYNNLSTLLTIIFSFFLFHDASVATLGVSIFAVIIVVAASFERGGGVPRNLYGILFVQAFNAVAAVASGYILLSVTSIDYYVMGNVLWFGIFVILSIPMMRRIWADTRSLPRSYYAYRIGGNIFGNTSQLIGFFLISSLGLLVSTLLGFLYTGVMMVFSYFFFREIPRQKDIILAVVLAILVAIGSYLR